MPDNKIFESNMAALEQKYPRLASSVRDGNKCIYQYEVIPSASGDPNILVKREQDFILLYDHDSPLEYCRACFDNLKLDYAPIVVFLGLGLGYHLHLFIRLCANRLQTKKIIVFEEDMGLFRLALRIVDLTDIILHTDIHLFVGDDFEQASMEIKNNVIKDDAMYYFMRSTKIIPMPSHILLNRQYCQKAVDTMKKTFSHLMILAGNDATDCFVGFDNLLRNIKNIVSNPGINLLFDKFRGRPAVMVASGPSLRKNMHLLRDIGDKALIVCCDASFVPLMKQNIRPHIVVTMERMEGTYHFFKHVPDFEDVYLIAFPLVMPSVFKNFKGEKIIANRPFSHFNWFRQDKGILDNGPWVGSMGFKAAEVLGCDPIIMIGQDLALAEDGDTHVKELVFGERIEMYYDNVFEVEGNDGRPVKTHRDWNTFRKHAEEELESYPGLCINATEGGAKIRGAQIMTFKEAIKAYCRDEFYPLSIIKEALSDFNSDLNVREELEEFLPRIRETRRALKERIKVVKNFHDEVRQVENEMIRPFMQQEAGVDREVLMGIIDKYVDFLGIHLQDENVKAAMLFTLQPYFMWFNNKFNFLPEVYSDEDCLRSAQVLMIREWLGVNGQFSVSTLDVLNRTEQELAKEIQVENVPG